MQQREHKHCRVCGRRMAWRRRWRHNWQGVRYCSRRCRRSGLTARDRRLETVMLALLRKRAAGRGVVCEEVAAAHAGQGPPSPLSAVRSAARRLHNRGVVKILQGGRPVDPSTAKGPFEIRLRSRSDSAPPLIAGVDGSETPR